MRVSETSELLVSVFLIQASSPILQIVSIYFPIYLNIQIVYDGLQFTKYYPIKILYSRVQLINRYHFQYISRYFKVYDYYK